MTRARKASKYSPSICGPQLRPLEPDHAAAVRHSQRTPVEWLFRVDGQPHGKKSVGAGFRGGRTTAPDSRRYMAWVAMSARMWLPREVLTGPLGVEIEAVIRRPQRIRTGTPPAPVKPDADNIAKAVLDGMKAHFRDEQVTDLRVTKRYASPTEMPRVEIRVWLIDEARAEVERAGGTER